MMCSQIKTFLLTAAFVAMSPSAQAKTASVLSAFDFVAPIVTDKDNLTSTAQYGTIVYDRTDGNFVGLDGSGTWRSLSTANTVVSSGSDQVIVSATISASGTPSIISQSGDWIASLVDNGTGDTTINIKSGVFSSAPTCTVSNISANALGHFYSMPTASVVRWLSFSSYAPQDGDFGIICMGAK